LLEVEVSSITTAGTTHTHAHPHLHIRACTSTSTSARAHPPPHPHSNTLVTNLLTDNAEISLDLDLHFQIDDPLKLLDRCRSPLVDLSHFLTADTTNFCGTRNFSVFKNESNKLNDITNFPQLLKVCLILVYLKVSNDDVIF
jgi:hypothetical protein